MNRIKQFSSVFYSFIVVLVLLYVSAKVLVDVEVDEPRLKVVPASQDVYVLGNSMFGVGFDLQAARSQLENRSVDFAYYNGHYTSMWHLGLDIGMEISTAPKIVVWGFRPTYAAFPAFRQNRATEEQEFRKHMNAAHRNILLNSGDPAYERRYKSNPQDTQEAQQFVTSEVFESLGGKIARKTQLHSKSLSRDSELLGLLVDGFSRVLADVAIKLGYSKELFYSDEKLLELNNLLVEYTTGGRIRVADALVVDNGEQFIRGKAVKFEDSFLPEIVKEIQGLRSKQLVVIFRPVTTYDQPLDGELKAFYEDALSYFNERGLLVLDLLATEGLGREMYADGDHLNEAGRKFVTDLIVEKLESINH